MTKDELLSCLTDRPCDVCKFHTDLGCSKWTCVFEDKIEELPSAERTGHWIQISPAKIYECSVCGQNVMTDDIDCYKYCHGCGVRMVSE